MGSSLSLLDAFWAQDIELVVIGLGNAGKTSLLNMLAHGHSVETIPTIGPNYKRINHGGVKMKVWDVGGQASQRDAWVTLTKEFPCTCIIFVLDAADPRALGEAKEALHEFLSQPHMKKQPILIAINKIDLAIPNRITKLDAVKALQLSSLPNSFSIQEISTLQEIGIDHVMEWIINVH